MAHALRTHLAALGPHLHPELVLPREAERLALLPDSLPPFHHSMLECRLGPGGGAVDFCWGYSPDELRGAEGLLAPFARAWNDPASPLADAVYHFELEFDADRPDVPSLFFLFAREPLRAIEAILTLFDRPHVALDRVVEALPPGCEINCLGLMLPRPGAAVRIGIDGMRQQEIVPFLIRAGWEESEALASFLATLSGDLAACSPVVAIDLHDSVGSRVGLEFLLAHDIAVRGERPRRMLEHLVGLGLCTEGQKDAILQWPTSPVDRFLGDPVERWISHVKIVCDGAIGAKCYLEARYH